MADSETVRAWRGRTMIDRNGGYVGTIDAVYVDEQSGRPEWALVRVGVAGLTATFVPIAEARPAAGGDVRVPFGKQLVKDAPAVALDRPLSAAEERELFRHYGLADDAGGSTEPATTDAGQGAGQAGDGAMTRSEEELRVRTERRERGRVRLRRYVETEQVQVTVPVRREKLRLEWEPAADAEADATTRSAPPPTPDEPTDQQDRQDAGQER